MPWFFGRRSPATAEASNVRLLEFKRPLAVRMNGHRNPGVIHTSR